MADKTKGFVSLCSTNKAFPLLQYHSTIRTSKGIVCKTAKLRLGNENRAQNDQQHQKSSFTKKAGQRYAG